MKRLFIPLIFFMPVLLSAQEIYDYGDVIINEIMADPSGLTELPETEYVEIYNTTNHAISLNKWTFTYVINESSNTVSALPDTILPPNGYAVLFLSGRDIQIDNNGITLPLDDFRSNLANTGKHLQLKDSSGIIIDSVTYAKAKPARSWEYDINDNIWYLSTDQRGGTPGSMNSPGTLPPPPDLSEPGDVIINEVMANQAGLTLLPETEYVEIYNTLDSAIALHNWKFIYNEKAYTIPDTVLKAKQYAILFKTDKNIHVDPTGIALGITSFPVLANNGKTISIKNSIDIEIDMITYDVASKAQSWERAIDHTWYLSTDIRGGTPGSINSPNTVPPPVVDPGDPSKPGDIIINEIMANPVGLTELPETEYIEIYNTLDSTVSLYGWKFIYDNKEYILPDTILHAGQYAVLFRSGYDIQINPAGIALSMDKFPVLANNGKNIGLKNKAEILIDHITYTKAEPARSWERDADNDWYLSTNYKGGTPGSVNSLKETPKPPVTNPSDKSKAGDILINEIMANPAGLTELPETEYIELYNTSDAAISLKNWTFVYDDKEITLPDTLIDEKSYAVLFRAGKNVYVENTGKAMPVDHFPANLANTGKRLQIKNSHHILIDSISYAPAKAARSWERDSVGNWYLSNHLKGGTPGAVNSGKGLPPPPTGNSSDHSKPGDIVFNEIMANPTGLTLLPETEYIELYNTSDTAISLKSWSFIYDNRIIELPDTTITANTYLVLFREGREIYIDKNGWSLPLANFPANLANTGKPLQVRNAHHTLIDSICYPAAKPGRAWERDAEGELYLSYDPRGGTPGAINSSKDSIYPPVDPEQPDSMMDYARFGDIVINEVMANPVGLTLLPETEYVELYNSTDTMIHLKGWSFLYDHKKSIIPDTFLSPGQYVVLYKSGRDIYVADHAIALSIPDFPANLANSGKILQIRNSIDTIIDSINYKTAKPARSWERDAIGSWYLSNDLKGGTPGKVNSSKEIQPVEPENPNDTIKPPIFIMQYNELIINEILPEPFVGGSEYIELYNRSERALSLSDLSIATRKTDGSLGTRYSLKNIPDTVYPDEYIALTNKRNGVLDFYYTPVTECIRELKLPTLNNTGATLVLFRTHDEFVIDQLTYSAKWHNMAIKNAKGVALERIDPDKETQDAGNWTSATDMAGYGTPGYKNSQYNHEQDQHQTFINIPEYDPAFNEYIITYQTDEPGYRCRMEIYTTEGRKVADISNNQLLATSGEIRWNGYGKDGSRLQAGIYVFFAELYHPNGKNNKTKQVLLIRTNQ